MRIPDLENLPKESVKSAILEIGSIQLLRQTIAA